MLPVLLILTIVPTCSATERGRTALPRTDGVSPAFCAEINAAWQAPPASFRGSLSRAGWQVQLAEFVVDAAPALEREHPRGWPAGTSWQQTDAVHLPKDRRLIVAEIRRTAQGKVIDSQRRGGVLRHELGHAYDLAKRGRYPSLSASPEFRAAHEVDISRMNATQRAALAYYLQSGAAGRQEAFAEALAICLGGGSDAANAKTFAAAFPNVLRFAKQHAL
jgi:hypothetical protein